MQRLVIVEKTFPLQNKVLMGEVMKEAAFSLAEAKFTAGDFSHTVLQNVSKAQCKVRAKRDNVAGVVLPMFEAHSEGSDRKWFLKTCSMRIYPLQHTISLASAKAARR